MDKNYCERKSWKEGVPMVWTVFAGLLLMGLGALYFLRPDLVWKYTERWKSYSADEPSDFYKLNTKIGGAVFFLVGLAGLLLPWIFPDV